MEAFMEDHLPLSGIRVLELGHIIAGPSGSLILAELGADVIKMESPKGGDQSRFALENSIFYAFNRNKRSITIDLKARSGIDLFLKLVKGADVVLDNYAPGVLERLGIGFETASRVNPRIIYCTVKGFIDGPNEHRPFLDELAQMMGGLAYMTGPLGQPLRAGASITDIGAATYGVVGILAALYDRERSGCGQQIRAGLFETVAFWVAQHMSKAGMTGEIPRPFPEGRIKREGGWGVYQLFDTADGRQIFIAVTSNAHWKSFCKAFDLQELYDDKSLDTNAKRAAQRERTIPVIQKTIGRFSFDELSERLESCRVPFAPVNTPADLMEDPHLNTGDHLLEITVPDGTALKLPSIPIKSDRFSYRVRIPPPELGEHTLEILKDTGLSDEEIRKLVDEGVVTVGSGPLR
jgi:crotonobetainyl-CoA:carnitine CoA-transferase CaiB-like acyl-CoA transferase